MQGVRLSSLGDDELMRRLATGEIEPLGELYVRHASLVKTALSRFAGEMSEAQLEDLLQDAFLVLRDTAGRYNGQERLRAWIYSIAVRTARHRRRNFWLRRDRLGRHHGETLGLAWDKDDSPERLAQAREQVHRALDRLPRRQREVVLLHAEGFSGEEIGRILAIRTNTVWTRLHRARAALAGLIGEGLP